MALVTREELQEEGWVYASSAMLICETRPDLWEAWVEHATHNIDWLATTSTKLGGRFIAFVASELEAEGKNFDDVLAEASGRKRE